VIEVRPARDEKEVAAALDLRHEVFCVEQGVTLAEERDGRDAEALHLVAVEDGVVIGTCRLLVEGATVKLGRMAVSRSRRGLGLARALLHAADAEARALGAERIVLGAQLTAQALYERAGYESYGEVFLDAGIEHVMMGRALD
jgi:predicted GNAT family N-acyltransferase